ncbi:M15 family metallopeptidase [Bordetella bronchiseptica]|uniref:M15 family metallopeptidase n=1 Tax=Bordetella bronchiseptica TaxID=518 RepID=UPI000461FD2A|nr:M15 family metallopeptidase [Bordetella bronchiseptica]KDC15368.1 serine-type D-Ala-D-Ala carboxypeptidase [Bordetella bronchiseptica F-1]KDC29302.1 serine-type D-Ala-D-Ala carboxypeptidase [Bordetella bronchiseptica F2]
MAKFILSQRSLMRLEGVHPRLVDIVKLAIERTAVDFMVVEGLRTPERQRELVAQGKSQTLNGLHLRQADGWGRAVDLAPLVDGAIPWKGWAAFKGLADVMKECAAELDVPLEWGGDWKTLKDGPHFQLPRGWKAPA